MYIGTGVERMAQSSLTHTYTYKHYKVSYIVESQNFCSMIKLNSV